MPSISIQSKQLFIASCLALLVTSLSFGIRAGILGQLGVQFLLNKTELAVITATAFWGFPLAIIIGGMVVDVVGMKNLHSLHLFVIWQASCSLFFNGFLVFVLSTLLIGIANGTVEAACNPLVTAIYPNNKTTRLNHFHLWFPGGIVIGTLIVYFFSKAGIGWQWQVATMLLPTFIYGYLFYRLSFPVTDRVASGVTTKEMYASLATPLFLFLLLCMLGTATTELFTGQWLNLLLSNVVENPILLLATTAGVMVVGRGLAGPVVHKLSPQGVLLASAVFAAFGIYLLANTTGSMLFVGALVFGIGVCYFWPTMLGFVSENLPKTGAVGINLLGGAGVLAMSLYTIFMGGVFDDMIAKQLPQGADLKAYNAPEATAEMKAALFEATKAAGPSVLNTTLLIPIGLILAFGGLFFYMRKKVTLRK
ncbi:MAG: MFS transporter [Bacteroidia bacterium]|nr:MFS transporter [Bacteroidia bacterium]